MLPFSNKNARIGYATTCKNFNKQIDGSTNDSYFMLDKGGYFRYKMPG